MNAVVRDGTLSIQEAHDGSMLVQNMSDGSLSISDMSTGALSLQTIFRERLIMIDSTGAMIIDSNGDLLTMYDYNLIKN